MRSQGTPLAALLIGLTVLVIAAGTILIPIAMVVWNVVGRGPPGLGYPDPAAYVALLPDKPLEWGPILVVGGLVALLFVARNSQK